MERVIWKGYSLKEFPRGFQGVGWGKGASGNSRSFLNKRNLRRLGEIMRNANLTQSFLLSLWLFLCLFSHFQFLGPKKAHTFSVDSLPGLGLRRTLEQSHSFVLKEK